MASDAGEMPPLSLPSATLVMRSISSSALESSRWRSPRRRDKAACGGVAAVAAGVVAAFAPALRFVATLPAGPVVAGVSALADWVCRVALGRRLLAAVLPASAVGGMLLAAASLAAASLVAAVVAELGAGFLRLVAPALVRRLATGLLLAPVTEGPVGRLVDGLSSLASASVEDSRVFSGFSLMGFLPMSGGASESRGREALRRKRKC
ncbi:MAG: hypothetical protein AW09_000595 [Candidatus Accumulibacter phosphatis]|uniref:Uncharacterized protein n=1 Tax=Candidatus Accumulibacter phosphatis TaxID=327160 RepID=A0A080LYW7_9PROT|nr:MAG: hypothetical protein AW09_000595 [Candidatus Accumulibacter phosphatis]